MSILQQALRELPSVEQLAKKLAPTSTLPRSLLTHFVKHELNKHRQDILAEKTITRAEIESTTEQRFKTFAASRLQPVINATGVVIHTNLGRSPLGPEAANTLTEIATGYCNLEFDLSSGSRGQRAGYLETALAALLGAESATAVNNCAAALVLTLRALCQGDKNEVIVSRGELVEIGGGFRIPEILETSGAKLVEVGATNKTNLNDYQKAITQNTAMILKVHRSNFYIGGFTEEPAVTDLAKLAHDHQLPLVEDIGSGAMMATDELAPIDHEPTPQDALSNGIDLVCFSGDKLLGGPQSGIIAGNKELITAIKEEPFFRAVRCDKLILTVLQESVDTYLATQHDKQSANVPALNFIGEDTANLHTRAEAIIAALDSSVRDMCHISRSTARTGGGTMPKSEIPSIALSVEPQGTSLNQLSRRMRTGKPAVVGTVENALFHLDLRTVFPHQDNELANALNKALQS